MNKDDIEHGNYIDIFHPNGFILDDNEKYYDNEERDNRTKKGELISIVLKNNSLLDNDFVNKMKSILPNGMDNDYIITDKEYELLKKEFSYLL